MYTLNLLAIALELAQEDPAYEDVASKFWEHFLYIANAMNHRGDDGIGLWDEEDGFFYDVLHLPDGAQFPMKIRSMVGLIPLFAVETLEPDVLDQLARLQAAPGVVHREPSGSREQRRLHDARRARASGGCSPSSIRTSCAAFCKYMLDEKEFLSPYGIRALSRFHRDHPYTLQRERHASIGSTTSRRNRRTGLFGGNSNWRGPIWFPVNYLLIESLQKFHHYLGDDFKVECPTGSGNMMTLWEVAAELSRRLTSIFLRDEQGTPAGVRRCCEKFQTDPHWRDLVLFYEYFHGDNGAGLGASHQTGWTGLVAKLMQQSGESRTRKRPKSQPAEVVSAS